MPRDEHVALLLAKAACDEHALDILRADASAPSEVMGFLAQQAAEKLLKAALKSLGVGYPYTHVLARLTHLLAAAGAAPPEFLHELAALTPYAGDLRYEAPADAPGSELDIARMRELICDLRAWVEGVVDRALTDPD